MRDFKFLLFILLVTFVLGSLHVFHHVSRHRSPVSDIALASFDIPLPSSISDGKNEKQPCKTSKECLKMVDQAKANLPNVTPGSVFDNLSGSKAITVPEEKK